MPDPSASLLSISFFLRVLLPSSSSSHLVRCSFVALQVLSSLPFLPSFPPLSFFLSLSLSLSPKPLPKALSGTLGALPTKGDRGLTLSLSLSLFTSLPPATTHHHAYSTSPHPDPARCNISARAPTRRQEPLLPCETVYRVTVEWMRNAGRSAYTIRRGPY